MVVLSGPESGPLAFLKGHKLGLGTPSFIKSELDAWSATQPAWVDVLYASTFGQGQLMTMGTPMQQARNFAVMTGVNSGISTLMRRVRGTEDVRNSLVAAFGSGVCFSLVSGIGKPGAAPGSGSANPLMAAFSTGVVFALFQGAFYKIGERFGSGGAKGSSRAAELEYIKVKAMLSTLGLSEYEKNFKRGLLEDRTIGLWDATSLAEVKVPPGPRLLILDHVDQYRHLLKPAGPLPVRKSTK
ncbi:hypothetical protein QBZ16_002857 [Prototheca wickerhamii]|uniref:SAM domain-containing protein n=1 Tax=Prototheca wickerhamii TaxID=3111 RepID=A0AAD9IK61_PROWI|nr:hypothetical protein QBZ16_002857 [Prototheca wickerhamii]